MEEDKEISRTKPFHPHQPEIMITVEISAREAHLLKILREIEFGEVIVKKIGGRLMRCEPKRSFLIDEKEGLDLAVD